MITSTGFYWCCAAGASAPVVVKNQSPIFPGFTAFSRGPISLNQARKRNPNPNFWVRISSGGVGVFHVNGWGPKTSVCPSKSRETKLFGGVPRDFAGVSRGCTKSLRKNVCVQFSFSCHWTTGASNNGN